MTNDNANGNGLDQILAAASTQAVPVNAGVCQALSEALDRARRGEIHALLMVGVRATDFASFDTVVVDNMALAMIMQGATMVAQAKITQWARDAQQQVPSSKIVRAPAGMRVG